MGHWIPTLHRCDGNQDSWFANGPSVRRGAEILGSLERWSIALAREENESRAEQDNAAIVDLRVGGV